MAPTARVQSACMVREILIACAVALIVAWIALIVTLFVARPKESALREALRLLPDTVRLVRRIASDEAVPRSVRWRLWLLLGYLAIPIDLVPDFVSVLGYADDAIIVAIVIRSVVSRAGPGVLRRHWPGTDDGLAALRRLARLPE